MSHGIEHKPEDRTARLLRYFGQNDSWLHRDRVMHWTGSGAVRMRGLLHSINREETSTVGNLGRASSHSKRVGIRNCRREMTGYVSASGAVGRIVRAFFGCEPKPDRALFASLSILPSIPSAGCLARRLRRVPPLLSEHLSSIVVHSLRELASVFLLRLSQLPRVSRYRLIESLGAFQAPRSPTLPRVQFCQEPMRGFTDCLDTPFLSVALAFHRQQLTTGALPNEAKSEARPGNPTARDGNAAG